MSDQKYTINGTILKPGQPTKKFIDYTGHRFTRYIVIKFAGYNPKGVGYWVCRCDCGTEKLVNLQSLKRGESKSCGCLNREIVKEANKIHGFARTKEYKVFHKARSRCQNPKDSQYHNYGARGIEFRFKDFAEYFEHVGKKPSSKHSLDRINNDGHYEKGNVHWTTQTNQTRNMRKNVLLTFNNQTKTIAEWAELMQIKYKTLQTRIKRGWCHGCAIMSQKCFHKI